MTKVPAMSVIWQDGEFVPFEDAKVHVLTHTLHYGFGVFVYEGGKSFGHAGLWPGYRTDVLHHLGHGWTIAVQTNRDGKIDTGAIVARVSRLLN